MPNLPIRLSPMQLEAIRTHMMALPRFDATEIGVEIAQVNFPDYVLARDMVEDYSSKGEELPPTMDLHKDKYAFYEIQFNATVHPHQWENITRGVKILKIDGTFSEGVSVDDVTPDSRWVPKNYSLTFAINADSNILEFVPVPLPGNITPKVNFEYNWNPKVAAVESGGTGNQLFWIFKKANDEYLDGQHQLNVLFTIPKTLKNVKLALRGVATYDLEWTEDDVEIGEGIVDIKLQ